MSSKLYVGNLSWSADDEMIRHAFSQFGKVLEATVARDVSGRSQGFAYVTFELKQEAEAAIAGLNEQELEGRQLKVNYPPAGR